MSNIANLKNVSKKYSEFQLKNINLEIKKGFIYGMIGPNGAGKTTTLKLLMNIIKPDTGIINILGMDYKSDEKKIKNKVGYVGEEQYFYEDKKVDWISKFVSQFYNEWDENYFNSLLTEFKISRTKKIRELSKGMKVKFSLALALSHNPDLLVLDEPTSGLDPVIRREILNKLKDITENNNKSVIISSHITEDLAKIADYISYIINGEFVLSSDKDTLLSSWKRIHYKSGILDEKITKSLLNVQSNAFGCSGITSNFNEIKVLISEEITKENVQIENVGLDDILISFAGGI